MLPSLLLLLAASGAESDVDVTVTGFLSERAQFTVPSLSSPLSTRDLPQLQSLTEASALLKLRLLEDRLTIVIDGSAFVTVQGLYADAVDGEHFEVVADHDVPADPRVVFAEAYLRLQPFEHLDVTVGKRRVVWGTGMAFNPTDILNPPRDPTDTALQRTGVPMVLVEAPFEGFALSTFFAPAILEERAGIPSALLAWPDVTPRESLQDPDVFPDPRDDRAHWAGAVRASALVLDTDINVWAIVVNAYGVDTRENDPRLALSLSRIFLDIHELHGEVLVQRGSDRLRVNGDCVDDDLVDEGPIATPRLMGCAVAGTKPIARDRLDDDGILPRLLVGTRSMFGDGTTVTVEYLYQADGFTAAEWDHMATLQTRIGGLTRDGLIDPVAFLSTGPDAGGQPARLAVAPQRQHHLVVGYSRPQIFDDFTVNGTAIVALEDLSSILTGSVQWQAAEWLQLSLWAFVPTPSLPRSLHGFGVDGAADVLWPAVVDGVPLGEYDAVPFAGRGMLEARVWF